VYWTARGLNFQDALIECAWTLSQSHWRGATHAARGLLLEAQGDVDAAYEAYTTALQCDDKFDRAFCYERRAYYEAARGWLRNALYSLQEALLADKRASGARVQTYQAALAKLEPLTPPDRTARTRELEIPAGFRARNELGEPLADDVIEIERLIRAQRWADVVTAAKALEPQKLVDAIRYLSRAVDFAPNAIALQELVVQAYEMWASWSTSGAEGISRTAEVERERARLRSLR
jgi:tetratricopeptide (TPR) repeat protein